MSRSAKPSGTLLALAGATVVIVATLGCVPDEPVPPFRVAQFGPGFEITHPGRRVVVEDSDGVMQSKIRLSSRSVRAYDAHGQLLGRLRPTAHGVEVVRRDFSPLCTGEIVEHTLLLDCGDEHGSVHVEVTPDRVAIGAVDSDATTVFERDQARWTSAGLTETDLAAQRTDPATIEVVAGDDTFFIADRHLRPPSGLALVAGLSLGQAWTVEETALVRGAAVWTIERMLEMYGDAADGSGDPAEEGGGEPTIDELLPLPSQWDDGAGSGDAEGSQ